MGSTSKFVLVNAGYEVTEAGEGHAALEKAHEQHPDLILLDMRLPVVDALEALKNLKEDPATSDIPVILLTSDGRDVQAPLQAGAMNSITKPFTADHLESEVRLAIDKSKLLVEKKQPTKKTAGHNPRPRLEENPVEKTVHPPIPGTDTLPRQGKGQTEVAKPTTTPVPDLQPVNGGPFFTAISARVAACAFLLTLLAVGISTLRWPMQDGIVFNVNFVHVWESMPFADEVVNQDDEFRRWNPWLNCVADNLHTGRGRLTTSREKSDGSQLQVTVGTEATSQGGQPRSRDITSAHAPMC